MEIYGMHDAPGGVQNMKSFEYLEKYSRINMPKNFLDPVLDIKLRNERDFYNKEQGTFIHNCNITNLIQFIKENCEMTDYMSRRLENVKGFKIAWEFLCLKNETYIYLRGKKKFLEEGWIAKVINSGKIDYIPQDIYYGDNSLEGYVHSMKFKVIGKVSNDTYLKIKSNPKSLWRIAKTEFIDILGEEILKLEL